MTPEQHRNQAALLRLSEDDESHRRAELHEKLAAAIERRAAEALAQDAGGFNEADHPRGQPGNAGQFGPGGGGSTAPAPKAQAAAPARRTGRTGAYAGQYETSGPSPRANHLLTVSRVLSNPVNRGIHYRRMLAQLIREAPAFNGQSAIPGLKAKLIQAHTATYIALVRAGRTAEADRALNAAHRLGWRPPESAAPAPARAAPTPAPRPETSPLMREGEALRDRGKNESKAIAEKLKNYLKGGTINQARAASLYEKYVKKDPEKFVSDMLGPMAKNTTPGSISISSSSYAPGDSMEVYASFNGGGSIKRTFTFNTGTVDHDYLVIPKALRNSGKEILAGQIKTYQELGMKRVKVHANIDVGAYAWAKYGFVPSVGSWNDLRRGLKMRTEAIRKGLTGGAYSSPDKEKAVEALRQIDTILDNPEPKAIWKVVDHPGTVTVGGKETTIAKVMMTGGAAPHWYGALDLADKETMGRFNGYVGKKS